MHVEDESVIESNAEAEAPEGSVEVEEGAEAESEADAEVGARLILKRNNVETDVVFAVNSPAIVGRFDPSVGPIDIDLGTIPEGSYVSRKHAKISEENGVWRIQDLGSSNGTFVLRDDFEKVDETEIQDGSEVAFGNARFVFRTA